MSNGKQNPRDPLITFDGPTADRIIKTVRAAESSGLVTQRRLPPKRTIVQYDELPAGEQSWQIMTWDHTLKSWVLDWLRFHS